LLIRWERERELRHAYRDFRVPILIFEKARMRMGLNRNMCMPFFFFEMLIIGRGQRFQNRLGLELNIPLIIKEQKLT